MPYSINDSRAYYASSYPVCAPKKHCFYACTLVCSSSELSSRSMLRRWMESECPRVHLSMSPTHPLPTLRIVASLVRAQPVPFLLNILRWLLVAIPATWTNSWLSYVQNKLALAYRTRLTQEVMKQYLGDEHDPHDPKVFYKLGESACVSNVTSPFTSGCSKSRRPHQEP